MSGEAGGEGGCVPVDTVAPTVGHMWRVRTRVIGLNQIFPVSICQMGLRKHIGLKCRVYVDGASAICIRHVRLKCTSRLYQDCASQ